MNVSVNAPIYENNLVTLNLPLPEQLKLVPFPLFLVQRQIEQRQLF